MIASVYVPFFFVEDYGLKLQLDVDISFYMLSIMNAARYGGISVMLPCCLFSAIILFFFRFANNLAGLTVVSILYGFISGGMVSLPPAIIANLTEDLSEYGTRMGMGLTIASLGALVGNPIGGAAQRSEARGNVQTQYQGLWLFAGACMLMAVAATLLTRYLKFGMTVKGKC